MTAEVAVLNMQGVALAADSAATVFYPDRSHKITSANKIVALSDHEPVGLMIYGLSVCMGVPWEVVAKAYRRHLGDRRLPHIWDYAADFFTFIADHEQLADASRCRVLREQRAQSAYLRIRNRIRTEVRSRRERGGVVAHGMALERLCGGCIKNEHQKWREASWASEADSALFRRLRDPSLLGPVSQAVFEQLPLSRTATRKLLDIGAWAASKHRPEFFEGPTAGVVLAGFGEDDVGPIVQHFQVIGVVERKVFVHSEDPDNAGWRTDPSHAYLKAFAQSEGVVRNFMEDIGPDFLMALVRELNRTLGELTTGLVQAVPGLSSAQRSLFAAAAQKIATGEFTALLERLTAKRQSLATQIVQVIQVLSKDELANLAEALVNTASLRLRFSPGVESVGGPIDVCVISKGDGLVWIKRKHYFTPDLNQRYLSKLPGQQP